VKNKTQKEIEELAERAFQRKRRVMGNVEYFDAKRSDVIKFFVLGYNKSTEDGANGVKAAFDWLAKMDYLSDDGDIMYAEYLESLKKKKDD